MSKMSVMKVFVTPEQAGAWLAANTDKNRHLNKSIVSMYADSMRRGLWTDNSDAIAFDCSGALINGQHRLHAIVDSGASIWMLVARNMDISAFQNMDRGRKRSLADVFTIEGHKHTALLAAVTRLVLVADRGLVFGRPVGSWANSVARLNVTDCSEFLSRNPAIAESVSLVKSWRLPPGMLEPTNLAFVHFFGAKLSSEDADAFARDMVTGESLSGDDPVHRLREHLFSCRDGNRPAPGQRINLLVRCWNNRRSGRKTQKVSRGRQASPETEIILPYMI